MNHQNNLKCKNKPLVRRKSDLIDFSLDTDTDPANSTLLNLFDPLCSSTQQVSSNLSPNSFISNSSSNNKTNQIISKEWRRYSSASTSQEYFNSCSDNKTEKSFSILGDDVSNCDTSRNSHEYEDINFYQNYGNEYTKNLVIKDTARSSHQLDRLLNLSLKADAIINMGSKSEKSPKKSPKRYSKSNKLYQELPKTTQASKDVKPSLKSSNLKLSRKIQRSSSVYVSLTDKLKTFREKYKHSDESTNSGIIYSPTGTTIPDLSVKITIASPLAKQPISFTCSTSTTIEHIVSHAVCSIFEKLEDDDSMQNYMLKIVGRNEFLDSTRCLGEYVYVHQCYKFNLDLNFSIIKKSKIKKLHLRLPQDDFRCKSLLSADDLFPRKALLSFCDLSFESLTIIIETFEKETERLFNDLSNKQRKLQPNGLIQTTKAICAMMMNCETLELTETTKNLFELCNSYNNEQSIFDGTDRQTMIETIESAISKVSKCMFKLMKLTSECLPVDYELIEPSSNVVDDKRLFCEQEKSRFTQSSASNNKVKVEKLLETSTDSIYDDNLSQLKNYLTIDDDNNQSDIILNVQGQVSFKAHNISQLKPEWLTKYQEFYIVCDIRYANKSLCPTFKSNTVKVDTSFFPRFIFDIECMFDVFYASLPREARLVITLIGTQIQTASSSGVTYSSSSILTSATNNNQLTPNSYLDFNPLRRTTSTTSIQSDTGIYSSSPRNSITNFSVNNNNNNNNKQVKDEPIEQELAVAIIYFFDHNDKLITGDKLIYLHCLESDKVNDIFIECVPGRNDPVILIELNNYNENKSIIFPSATTIESPALNFKNYDQLSSGTQFVIQTAIEKMPHECLLDDDKSVLWINRLYLSQISAALPKLLLSVPCWSAHNLNHIYKLIDNWTQLALEDALQLLLPLYADSYVRSYAVKTLAAISTAELYDLIPQLLQALRFEKSLDCELFWLLIDRSLKCKRFSCLMYWQAKTNSRDKIFNQRSEFLVNCLLMLCGASFHKSIDKQEELLNKLSVIQDSVRLTRDSQRMSFLHNKLELIRDYLTENKPSVPYSVGLEVCDLDVNSCLYFTSNALPLKLAFKSFEETCNGALKINIHETIFKAGDDLRQDMLAIQMIRIMEKLWLREGLDLRMVTFECLETNELQGLVEVVQNAETLRKIQQSRSKLRGPFEKRPIVEWLQTKNTSELEYQQARDNFTHSCAGYAVATYLLGICDRHNDNIMVTSSGHLFHIDFGKFLGDVQMMGSIKRDRTPFVLTADMAYVINNGDRPSKKFQTFIELCLTAFNILRENRSLILGLFALLATSKIHNISSESVKYIDKMLMPGLSKAQAMAKFARMIDECLASRSTSLNFFIHNLAQLRFSNESSKQSMLSFIPTTFSMLSDGKIESLDALKACKRLEPEKQYYYLIRVKRFEQLDPTYIMRTFDEFIEFEMKLNSLSVALQVKKFEMNKISKSMSLIDIVHRKKNTREIANQRLIELRNFLHSLLILPAELSESDLVYTFFHPILRDQFTQSINQLNISSLSTINGNEPFCMLDDESLFACSGSSSSADQSTTTFGQREYSDQKRTSLYLNSNGQVKVSLVHKHCSLTIVVMHAKNLLTPDGKLPNAYVKTYLQPDLNKTSKRKTRVVRQTQHPSFMELIVYNELPLASARKLTLRVSVWHSDGVVASKYFMGEALIVLDKIDLSKESEDWYPLRNR